MGEAFIDTYAASRRAESSDVAWTAQKLWTLSTRSRRPLQPLTTSICLAPAQDMLSAVPGPLSLLLAQFLLPCYAPRSDLCSPKPNSHSRALPSSIQYHTHSLTDNARPPANATYPFISVRPILTLQYRRARSKLNCDVLPRVSTALSNAPDSVSN